MHKLNISRAVFPNPDAPVDINSPSFYCGKCEKHMSSGYGLVIHLKNVHKLTVPTRKRPKANPNATIDINDPNFYCA